MKKIKKEDKPLEGKGKVVLKLARNIFSITILTMFLANTIFAQAKSKDKIEKKDVEILLGLDKVVELDFEPHLKMKTSENVIAQIVRGKKQVLIQGTKAGKGYVRLWDLAGDMRILINVAVKVNDNAKTIKELKDFLGDIEGLEIGIKGEKVYVGGKIIIPDDMGKIALILQGHEKVLRLVELAPQTQAYIGKKMEQEIHRAGLRDITVRVVNKIFWLEGVVGSKAERTLAYKIAEAYIPDSMESLSKLSDRVKSVKKTLIQNFISVNVKPQEQPVPKMIKITSQFVELTRDYQKIFGFKWNPLMATGGEITLGRTSEGGVKTSSAGSLMGKISQLFPQLASAKSAGNARVIQSGMVLCENQVECKVKKEKTQNFSVGTSELSKPQQQTTGFELTVKPTLLVKENIHLDMNVSVSATDGGENAPGNTLNQVKSRVVVKNKESAVIGGIVVNTSKRRFDKDPPGGTGSGDSVEGGFSLFSFVRSKGYEQSKNQFAVFITPEIIESASLGTEEIKSKFRKRTR